MKGLSVVRTLGKCLAPAASVKTDGGGDQAGKHTAQSNGLFLSPSNVKKESQ